MILTHDRAYLRFLACGFSSESATECSERLMSTSSHDGNQPQGADDVVAYLQELAQDTLGSC